MLKMVSPSNNIDELIKEIKEIIKMSRRNKFKNKSQNKPWILDKLHKK